MKVLAITLVVLLTGSFVFAQRICEAMVPEPVKIKISALYPEARVERWYKTEGNKYEARWGKSTSRISVDIDSNGILLDIRIVIHERTLPFLAEKYVTEYCPGEKIKQVIWITYADCDVCYCAELKEQRLFFDLFGSFLRKEGKKNFIASR